MTNNRSRIKYLLAQYAEEEASKKEVNELFMWMRKSENEEDLTRFLTNMLESMPPDENYDKAKWEGMIQQIIISSSSNSKLSNYEHNKGTRNNRVKRQKWLRSVAAVFIATSLFISTYWIITNNNTKLSTTDLVDISVRYKNDVSPGTNKAILTLGDSSTILLDDTKEGMLGKQGNVEIIKLANGRISYKSKNQEPAQAMFNTIKTPRGGKYEVILPDGSRVWLNATSSIKFPTSFTGKQREVSLTGEAYFEVAKNPQKPFIVHITFPQSSQRNAATIKVLGTHFNVMAYANEKNIKTTLLEGSVQVANHNGKSVKIIPGEQAQLQPNNKISVIPDDGQATAWKDGLFLFKSADIHTIMRQVSRWYDVDIVYEDQPTTDKFSGTIPRSANLSQLLKILELSEVHFKIEGKTLTVMPSFPQKTNIK